MVKTQVYLRQEELDALRETAARSGCSGGMVADPERVTVPFLSILGAGDSPVFARQANAWDQHIRSERKRFVRLDAASGADGHVQVNNRLRLAQECAAWMDELFGNTNQPGE